MTRSTTACKVWLIADRRPVPTTRDPAPVRRYRLARLRFAPPPGGEEARFEYLKRVYD